MKKNILFVVAIKEEVDLSFLEKYKNVHYLYTGIGKVNSAIVLMDYLSHLDKQNFHIVNVGTCGSSIYKIGDVISVSECCEYGSSFVSKKMKLDDISYKVPFCTKKDTILSSDFFISLHSMNSKEFQDFSKTCCNFDMEVAAEAKVCEYYNIPFSAFKIVSDDLTSTIVDWRKMLKELSPTVEKIVRAIVKNLSLQNDGKF